MLRSLAERSIRYALKTFWQIRFPKAPIIFPPSMIPTTETSAIMILLLNAWQKSQDLILTS